MANEAKKRILLVCRQAPYGNALAREAIEIALAASVFDQNLALVFIGDGVWQLNSGQDSSAIKYKNQEKLLSALALYDISEIYADGTALSERNITDDALSIAAKALTDAALAELLETADVILNF